MKQKTQIRQKPLGPEEGPIEPAPWEGEETVGEPIPAAAPEDETQGTQTQTEPSESPDAAEQDAAEATEPRALPERPAQTAREEGEPPIPPRQRVQPPPKAYIRPALEMSSLSYSQRAALYLSDRNEYRQMTGGNRQWK